MCIRDRAYDEDDKPDDGDVSEQYSQAGDDARWFYFQTNGKAVHAEDGTYKSCLLYTSICTMSAYIIARKNNRFYNTIYYIFVGAMIIPFKYIMTLSLIHI